MRVGVLTGGGDCPGLNAVIRGIVRKGITDYGDEIIGFRYGWKGPIENLTMELTLDNTRGILHKGGTILRSSRTNPFKIEGGVQKIAENLAANNIDCLIPIGGEDTLGAANKLHGEGIAVIGVPKTIDNDLSGTDYTFGFDTAVNIAMEAIDRCHSTAESHDRVIVVEVMGRHAGWIALHSGMAGGADVILVPEFPFDIDNVCEHLQNRHAKGINFSIVVAAEGAMPKEGSFATLGDGGVDAFGHARLGGIAQALEKEIESRTGFETRHTVLGHIQRGGSPTAFDRVLGSRFGVAAIDAVHAGERGKMVALRGTDIAVIDLQEAVGTMKLVDEELFDTAKVFFG
ncbi:MAG TPA: ATP-dependent 6-phosphofructokinase [Actinomycetota bacterium]|nr:ATP-dependent 6-phosphofructokinase [Actinomycetota bacterium]